MKKQAILKTLKVLLVLAATVGFGLPVVADSKIPVRLEMVTGQKTGTYFVFGRDIETVAKKYNIDLTVRTSEGSFDNIKLLSSDDSVNLAIVQADVLGFFGRTKNPDAVKALSNLRVVYPLYKEEVHVLARNEIKDFKDLQGKKVAVGEDGSGNMLTSLNLFSILGVTPAETKKIPAAQGVVAVLKGDVDAAVFVGGKPVRLFKNLEDLNLPENQKYAKLLDGVHFVPLDSAKLLEEYKPAEITAADYKFVKENIPTIAVQSLMVSRDIPQDEKQLAKKPENKARCEKIDELAKAIRTELPALKETGHAKWKEVELDANIGSWKKDGCVWQESNELLNIIDRK